MKLQKPKADKGFTLIEILVVAAVSAFLMATLLVFNRGSGRSIILINEHAKLIQAITTAKSLSVQTFIEPNLPPGSLKTCGYGVYFENNKYSIFKDTPLPDPVASSCVDAGGIYTGNKVFDSYEMGTGPEFIVDNEVNIKNLPGGVQGFNIVFIPPEPKTYFFPPVPGITITLELVGGNSEMSVKVNDFGQITSAQ